MERRVSRRGRDFDPDRFARLELAMWKAYYRRNGLRLFRLRVRANAEQAGVGLARAVLAAIRLAWAAVRLGRVSGHDERFEASIAASGLAALPFGPFLAGLVVGNGLFVGAHLVLGMVVGPPAVAVASASTGVVIVVGLAVLALLGVAGWLALRRRRRAGAGGARAAGIAGAAATKPLGLIDGLGAWPDAACPACLAVDLVRGGSR